MFHLKVKDLCVSRPRVMRCVLKVLLLGCVATWVGCVYVGTYQRRISVEPLRVVDASLETQIQEVLVIPHYSSFDGVAVTPEGPAQAIRHDYLAKPFIYLPGRPFKPRQPNSAGVFWGPIFTGKVISLEGVTILAAGYQRNVVNDFWQVYSFGRQLGLTRISPQASSRELQTALDNLQKSKLETADEAGFWGLADSHRLEIRFTPEERELVVNFLKQALQNLSKNP